MEAAATVASAARTAPAPRWLAAYATFVRGANRVFAATGIALVALLMLTILQDVVSRYVLRDPPAWGVDFSRHMLTYLFFCGLAPALASGHHVAVDLFEAAVPGAVRRWLPLLSSMLCVVFGAILLWFLARATLIAYRTGALTPTMVSIPVWWVYAIGPAGALQFVLTALLQATRAWRGEPIFDTAARAPDAAAAA